MIRRFLRSALFILAGWSPAMSGQIEGPDGIRLVPFEGGFDRPVEIAHAGDARLFVVEQAGKIKIVKSGRLLPEPFLDITDRVSCCGERGLLGLAFPPDHRDTGYLFVNYTNLDGDTVVARLTVPSSDPDRASRASHETVLTVTQPFANHNGGQMRFGPDGMLWIGMGDGGGAGDPMNNAQSLATLLGKMLRIDVSELPYTIPPDNPYVAAPGARPEIWSHGWRNPWRFSFDRVTSELFVGDVGQGEWEEIDREPPGAAGRNYGWSVMEGAHCFDPRNGCDSTGLVLPILEYSHDEGCSVTAGFRYRGTKLQALESDYLYGDFCSGTIWRADDGTGDWTSTVLMHTSLRISAFGEDQAGEIYVAGYTDGVIYRFESEGTRRRATRRP